MSEWECSCTLGHIDEIGDTNFLVLRLTPHDVSIHRHEDDSSFELFWLTNHVLHHFLNLGEKLQPGKSWEIFPFELHRFSVDSIQSCVFTGFLEPIQFALPCFGLGIWQHFPRHNRGSENM